MYAKLKSGVLTLLLITSLLIVIEYLHLGSHTTIDQLGDGSTRSFAIYDNMDRTGRNLKWAEDVEEEEYIDGTLFPTPSVSESYTESPTARPHLSWNETLRIINVSQNPNISARSKWQVLQVDKFCSKYHMNNTMILLSTLRKSLFRHLLFNDKKKFVFCFLPKAGCTNLRRLVLIINGLLPKETAKLITVSEEYYLTPALRKASFLNKTLTDMDRMRKIETYYKFMMVRNPLERLVSAYRDKLERNLTFNETYDSSHPLLREQTFNKGVEYFETHRRWIMTKYRPLDFLKWAHASGTYELQVTFSDYIQWIIDTDRDSINEHFASILSVSRPCMVRYHFYANFKNYSREVHLLVQRLNTSIEYFTDHNTHDPGEETRVLLHKYYSQLSPELKYRLFKRMFVELDFYYHLYPEEQWSHAELLGITEPVLT